MLDVSGCKGLTSVRAPSAQLAHAIARACPRLQELRLESCQLLTLDVVRAHAAGAPCPWCFCAAFLVPGAPSCCSCMCLAWRMRHPC